MYYLLPFLFISVGLAEIINPGNDSKIVGGKEVNIKDFPYQLFLNSSKGRCGGSIISDTWALTAAHCLYGATVPESNATFRAGSTSRVQGGTTHAAVKIIVHPKYNNGSNDYDYALVEVTPPFPLGTPGVEKINLATVDPPSATIVTASGWGLTVAGSTSLPVNLRAVDLKVRDKLLCRLSYGSLYTPRTICAGLFGANVCNGDSGGPLVDRKQMVQVGIMSMTIGCLPGASGLFSDIANQRQWIIDVSGA